MEPTDRCPHCGIPRTAADARGLAWSSRHTADGVEWICAGCTRGLLGEIECSAPGGAAPARPGP